MKIELVIRELTLKFMKKRLLVCVVLSFAVWNVFSSEREVTLLDKGWSFIQKDIVNGESVKLNDSEW